MSTVDRSSGPSNSPPGVDVHPILRGECKVSSELRAARDDAPAGRRSGESADRGKPPAPRLTLIDLTGLAVGVLDRHHHRCVVNALHRFLVGDRRTFHESVCGCMVLLTDRPDRARALPFCERCWPGGDPLPPAPYPDRPRSTVLRYWIPKAERSELGAKLREQYERGVSIRQLAMQIERSYGCTHRLLVEAGTTMRTRGGDQRRYRRMKREQRS